ncbi:unnamed protein product, partial [Tilletia laevis]
AQRERLDSRVCLHTIPIPITASFSTAHAPRSSSSSLPLNFPCANPGLVLNVGAASEMQCLQNEAALVLVPAQT